MKPCRSCAKLPHRVPGGPGSVCKCGVAYKSDPPPRWERSLTGSNSFWMTESGRMCARADCHKQVVGDRYRRGWDHCSSECRALDGGKAS